MRRKYVVGVREAKARLSSLLQSVENGEEVIITRHGKAVAKMVRIKENDKKSVVQVIEKLEEAGIIEKDTGIDAEDVLGRPVKVEDELHQKILRQHRNKV